MKSIVVAQCLNYDTGDEAGPREAPNAMKLVDALRCIPPTCFGFEECEHDRFYQSGILC
jgi:hypothetical protein